MKAMKVIKLRRIALSVLLAMLLACTIFVGMIGATTDASADVTISAGPTFNSYKDGKYNGASQISDIPLNDLLGITVSDPGDGGLLNIQRKRVSSDKFKYGSGTYRIEGDTQQTVDTTFINNSIGTTTTLLNSKIGYGKLVYRRGQETTFGEINDIFDNYANTRQIYFSQGDYRCSIYFEYNNTKLFGYMIWNIRIDFTFTVT